MRRLERKRSGVRPKDFLVDVEIQNRISVHRRREDRKIMDHLLQTVLLKTVVLCSVCSLMKSLICSISMKCDCK